MMATTTFMTTATTATPSQSFVLAKNAKNSSEGFVVVVRRDRLETTSTLNTKQRRLVLTLLPILGNIWQQVFCREWSFYGSLMAGESDLPFAHSSLAAVKSALLYRAAL